MIVNECIHSFVTSGKNGEKIILTINEDMKCDIEHTRLIKITVSLTISQSE